MISKILFVEGNTDGTIGGSYFSLLYLIKNLNQFKYISSVVFYSNHSLIPDFKKAGANVIILKYPKQFDFKNILLIEKSKYFKLIIQLLQKLLNFFLYFFLRAISLSFFIKKNKFDIVHLNNSVTKNHEWMLATLISSTPCITHERGINDTFTPSARYLGRRLGKIICISNAVKQNFIDKGLNHSNLVTIHNGIDPDDLKINISPEKILKQYGVDPSVRIFGMVGNIKIWKGQKFLVKALNRFKQSCAEPFVCFFVGAVPDESKNYEGELKKLIRSYKLHNNVIFTGYVKNPADFINMFEIVIHASILPEPFGRVLLEAMALKKPIIAANIGAPVEIILHGESGLLVNPMDADSLSDNISFLLSNELYRRRIGENAFERIKMKFSIKRNVKLTESIYEKLLNRKEKCTLV